MTLSVSLLSDERGHCQIIISLLELFDKLVSPIFNFGSEVWGFYKSSAIETVHLLFCKKILGVKQSTQNDFVYGELGRMNYQFRRYIIIIKYWLKVISNEENKYIKQIYNPMLNDLNLQQNWASSVKNLLSRVGFLHVREAQGVGNENAFFNIFKQKINDIFTQDWHSRLENSTRAICYLTYAKFQISKVFRLFEHCEIQKCLSWLWLSSHRLQVEVVRWAKPNKIPYENRKFQIYNVLEDEFHFLLECPLYDNLRKAYINKYYWRRSSMLKFVQLLSNEHGKTLKHLSVYIDKVFQLHKDTLLL